MLLVGLTGGIGSGKSTVATQLAAMGAVIVDADAIARDIVAPGQPALRDLVLTFGPRILMEDGTLNRTELARLAFSTPEATAKLNAITHPRIHAEAAARFRAAPANSIVVFDMPLLVENNLAPQCGVVIVVTADRDVRLDRLVTYRGLDRDDAARRMDAQLSDAERTRAADIVLDNSGARERLENSIRLLYTQRLVPWAEWAHGGDNPHTGFDDVALSAPSEITTSDGGVRSIRPTARAERLRARLMYALEAELAGGAGLGSSSSSSSSSSASGSASTGAPAAAGPGSSGATGGPAAVGLGSSGATGAPAAAASAGGALSLDQRIVIGGDPEAVGENPQERGRIIATVNLSGQVPVGTECGGAAGECGDPAVSADHAPMVLSAQSRERLGWLGFTEDPCGTQWVSGDPFNPVLLQLV